MKQPIIPQFNRPPRYRRFGERIDNERGITMLLVAIAMLTIIGMAALAIDVVTLYLAREEAQRAADAGALAGARVLAMSGVTGDPDNLDVSNTTIAPWPKACTLATQVAAAVANQNGINSAVGTPTVTFSYNGTATDCNIGTGQPFGANPQVQVQVVRNGLPSLFSRIWKKATNTITVTATAEAYNPALSENYTPTADVIPVYPRCVKPWVIPNQDPNNQPIIDGPSGKILNEGIQISGGGSGVIGEVFQLQLPNGPQGCNPADCKKVEGQPASYGQYIAPLVSANPAVAVPSCANSSNLEQAIGGCDVTTVYPCGSTSEFATLDFTVNPGSATGVASDCLIRFTAGPDTLDNSNFPFQIKAGPANPFTSVGQPITASTSIVTLPIFDSGAFGGKWPSTSNQPAVTIIGFLQLFLQNLAPTGSSGLLQGTVLNVTGCGNGQIHPVGNPVYGSSPVPVRLITPPSP